MTADHPLRDEDYHLIQDYVLTKVVFALNADSTSSGWDHEIDRLQHDSESFWVRRNAFLFDYTLARLLIACVSASAERDESITGSSDEPLREFIDAVEREQTGLAEHVWSEANAGAPVGDGLRLPTTVPLVARLREIWQRVETRAALDTLPPEYFPSMPVS